MKKMNRSQSSYRPGKTLLTEACEDNFINKYASRNYPPKNQVNVAFNDMDANKENSSLFQSVSQRNFGSKSRQQISQFDIGQDLNKKVYKKDNLKEQSLMRSRDQRDYFSKNYDVLNISKGYKYSQSYYQSQIESLKEMIRQKDRELQCYKIQNFSKSDDLDSMAEEMSSKIERDNKEKNMYIRQLNATVIEKNSLQERLKINRAEIQTLKLCINEKDKALKEFEEKLGQVDMKKKKVEQYDYQIKEYHQALNQLQHQIQKLKEQRQTKDYIIQEKSKLIVDLQQTIGSYEDKLKSIQESLIKISQDRKILSQKNQQLKRECFDWKRIYDQQLRKSGLIQEYEIKIKTYQQRLQQAGRRLMQMISLNEKNKIALTTYEKSMEKFKEIEKQMNIIKKDLKERDERLMQFQTKQKKLKQLQQSYLKLGKQRDDSTGKLQEKMKQCKNLILQLEQQKNRADLLQEELNETEENNNRLRQRGQKMQVLMKQNNRLTSSLHQKVDQIEKLQIKINNMDIKLNEKSNEASKLKENLYQYQQEISQLKLEVQDIRERYQAQTNNRILNEDKVLRCTQQIFAHKSTISKLETQNKQIAEKFQQFNLDHLSEINGFKQTLSEMTQHKIQSQHLLQKAKLKLQVLQSQVQQCRGLLAQSQLKEREHKGIMIRLEEHLVGLRESNQILRKQKDQIIEKCNQLKEIHSFVMNFKSK